MPSASASADVTSLPEVVGLLQQAQSTGSLSVARLRSTLAAAQVPMSRARRVLRQLTAELAISGVSLVDEEVAGTGALRAAGPEGEPAEPPPREPGARPAPPPVLAGRPRPRRAGCAGLPASSPDARESWGARRLSLAPSAPAEAGTGKHRRSGNRQRRPKSGDRQRRPARIWQCRRGWAARTAAVTAMPARTTAMPARTRGMPARTREKAVPTRRTSWPGKPMTSWWNYVAPDDELMEDELTVDALADADILADPDTEVAVEPDDLVEEDILSRSRRTRLLDGSARRAQTTMLRKPPPPRPPSRLCRRQPLRLPVTSLDRGRGHRHPRRGGGGNRKDHCGWRHG